MKQKLFWNSILRFMLQSYLKNSLAVMFSIYVISFRSGNDTGIINGVIALVLLLVLIGLPLLFALVMHRNR